MKRPMKAYCQPPKSGSAPGAIDVTGTSLPKAVAAGIATSPATTQTMPTFTATAGPNPFRQATNPAPAASGIHAAPKRRVRAGDTESGRSGRTTVAMTAEATAPAAMMPCSSGVTSIRASHMAMSRPAAARTPQATPDAS